VTRGGSGRDGLGALRDADSFSARRRKLLVDESAAASEAANASNAVWPKLAEVPPLLRCSGCELTLAALHARAATAARRLRPPSWTVAAEETKEALVFDNWNGACGALAADERLRVVEGVFDAGDAFIARVWEEATEAVLNERTRTNATRRRRRGSRRRRRRRRRRRLRRLRRRRIRSPRASKASTWTPST
jgi:hypothetical protein